MSWRLAPKHGGLVGSIPTHVPPRHRHATTPECHRAATPPNVTEPRQPHPATQAPAPGDHRPMPDQPGVPAPRQLVYTRLCDFRSMPGNPKAHDIPLIAASIDTHGFTDPVEVCERTGYVSSGHGRVEALHHMRSTGYAGTPEGIVLDDDGEWCVPTQRGWASKDDDHLRAYVIGANKTGMSGGWDDHLLADMAHSLVTSNAELFDTLGFTDDDMDDLLTITDPDRLDQGPEDDNPDTEDEGGAADPERVGGNVDPLVGCPDCGSTFHLSESELN